MSSVKSEQHLNQKEAQEIDRRLVGEEGFTFEVLMELAGLSVAQSIASVYNLPNFIHVLIVVGPGNNGGDGLVAARHLHHFGYKPTIVYPKRPDKKIYKDLMTQCQRLHIPIFCALPDDYHEKFSLVVDAIFGFSFSGDIRAPFDSIVKSLQSCKLAIASIDVPSGWDVEKGNSNGVGLEPECLRVLCFFDELSVSLTAPKICAALFKGKLHFLGGRFVPDHIAEEYELNLPLYKSYEQFVQLPSPKL